MENVATKVNDGNEKFRWTPERIEKLRRLKQKRYSDLRIAVLIGDGCTEGQARYAANCLDAYGRVSKGRSTNQNKNFSTAEREFIRDTYCRQGLPVVEIAEELGRSPGSVRTVVYRMKLTRSDPELSERKNTERRGIMARAAALRSKEATGSLRKLWTVRTDRQRAKLYNGHRYEDAIVPKHCPPCGRLG